MMEEGGSELHAEKRLSCPGKTQNPDAKGQLCRLAALLIVALLSLETREKLGVFSLH